MSLHSAYDTLPSLKEAKEFYEDNKRAAHLAGPIRDGFITYGMHEKYGVSLLHNHFLMGAKYRLVEYNHTATPWEIGESEDWTVNRFGGNIKPTNFRFTEGKLLPFEFSADFTDEEADEELDPKFLAEYQEALDTHGMTNTFGLRKRDLENEGKFPMEMTQGYTIVMLPKAEEVVPTVEAFWTFSSGVNKSQDCHVNCRLICCLPYDAHYTRHFKSCYE